ncbi:MAG: hypothetical protein R3E42_15460 [Burkholderiaceae bacterium]
MSDRTGERVRLLRYGATAALVISFGLWMPLGGVAMFFSVAADVHAHQRHDAYE